MTRDHDGVDGTVEWHLAAVRARGHAISDVRIGALHSCADAHISRGEHAVSETQTARRRRWAGYAATVSHAPR